MKNHPLWANDKLGADSLFYNEHAPIYEQFSQAEDAPKKVSQFLIPKIQDKTVLDFGCGTGKFIPEFAPLVQKYFAVDISENQLAVARTKAAKFENVEIVQAYEASMPLDSDLVDITFAAWVLGSIHDLGTREKVVEELKRVTKTDGSIYLIENDIGGEFKNIIEGNIGNEKTRLKQEWLEIAGFKKIQSLETNFQFWNLEEAKDVFDAIWGEETAQKVVSKEITHNVAIYEYTK